MKFGLTGRSHPAPKPKSILRPAFVAARGVPQFLPLVLLVAAELILPWPTTAKSEDAHVLKVGAILPLSGNFAPVGSDGRVGIETAIASSQTSTPIQIVYADSKGDPATAVTEFRKLTSTESASAVLAFRGPIGMALNPISKELRVPLLGAVGNVDFAAQNPFAVQVWSRADVEGAYAYGKIHEEHASAIAIITAQDDWTSAVSAGFRAAAKNDRGNIVFDQEFLPADNDFRSTLTLLKARHPDAIFLNLTLAQLAPFIQQLRSQQLPAAVFSNFWISKKEVVEAAGAAALDGVKFVEMDTNLPNFRRVLEEKFHVAPSGATLSMYVGTMLLTQVAQTHPEARTVSQIAEAIAKETEIRTPDRSFPIRDRYVEFPLTVKTMRNGKPE